MTRKEISKNLRELKIFKGVLVYDVKDRQQLKRVINSEGYKVDAGYSVFENSVMMDFRQVTIRKNDMGLIIGTISNGDNGTYKSNDIIWYKENEKGGKNVK